MRVAMCDRQKFNEAVANNFYTCAPSTIAGKVRLFNEDDLVVLFVFARLLESGVLPRRAGQLACELKGSLRNRDNEPIKRVTYVRGTMSDVFFDTKDYKSDVTYGAGPTLYSTEWHIDTIREIIVDRVEYENSILGIEGEDD